MIATRKTCVEMAVQTEVRDLIERLDWQFIVVALSQAHFVVFTNSTYQTNFISPIILFPSCSLLQIDPRRKPDGPNSHSINFLGQAVHGNLILYATPKVNIM